MSNPVRILRHNVLSPLKYCWPAPDQELLLRAALWQGRDAVDAWNEWKAKVAFADLDQGSYRLLPLLYNNLCSLRVEDPLLKRIKGVYRLTWSRNLLLFHNLAEILRSFAQAGIETMLLKGVALVLRYYRNYGLRPMDDFDVLVRPADSGAAMELLDRLGWQSNFSTTGIRVPLIHSVGFSHHDNRHFDLHWHVMEECCLPDADDDFWTDSAGAQLGDLPTRALNSTDQLLHVCVHGARWNSTPPFRWIADAMVILGTAPEAIDWGRLTAQAERGRLGVPMHDALAYLQAKMGAPVPSDVLQNLRSLSGSKAESFEYWIKTRKRNHVTRLLFHWFNYQRLSRGQSRGLMGFPRYPQHRWGVSRPHQVPAFMVSESIRRSRKRSKL